MDLRSLILLVVKVSIFLTVLAVGFRATADDVLSLLHRPRQLAWSLVSMFFIVPAVAVFLIVAFSFHRAVEIALVALALSPVPPLLPRTLFKAGARQDYTVSLLAIASLLAVVFIPAALAGISRVAAKEISVPPEAVAKVVFLSVLAPLIIGMIVRQVAPRLSQRLTRPTALIGTVLLVAAVIPMLFTTLPSAIGLIGNGTLAALVVFELAGLGAGHVLGGPDPGDRTVLALASASRHPGVALTVGTMAFPNEKLEISAIVLYLFVSAALTTLYLAWRRHGAAGAVTRSTTRSAPPPRPSSPPPPAHRAR